MQNAEVRLSMHGSEIISPRASDSLPLWALVDVPLRAPVPQNGGETTEVFPLDGLPVKGHGSPTALFGPGRGF